MNDRRGRRSGAGELRWCYELARTTVAVLFHSPAGIPDHDPFPLQRVPGTGSASLVLEVLETDSGWEIFRKGECLSVAETHAELLGALEWCVTTSVLQRRTDRVVLHAATLSTPGRRGHVLIVGPHGAGKTTLALALGRERTYRLHGDDVALLDPESGNVEAFPRPLYWKAISDPPIGPAYDTGGGVRLLPTSVLAPVCPTAPCRAIVFPCREPGVRAELRSLGDAKALMRMGTASFFRGPTAFDAVVRMVRGSAHWVAAYDDARDLLAPLLETLDPGHRC